MQPVGDEPRADAALAGLMAGAGDDLQASARTLFDGESFVVSDHNQVGNPIAYASPQFEALTLYAADEVSSPGRFSVAAAMARLLTLRFMERLADHMSARLPTRCSVAYRLIHTLDARCGQLPQAEPSAPSPLS